MPLTPPFVPEIAIIQGDAARIAEAVSTLAWQQKRSECGGLLWGRLLEIELGDAAWVAAMTPGIGHASAVEFEIEPESYVVGQRILRDAGFPDDLIELGLWHSHPGYGAFLSTVDEDYFRLCFPQAWKLSVVIDPLRYDRAVFIKNGTGFSRIRAIDTKAHVSAVSLRSIRWQFGTRLRSGSMHDGLTYFSRQSELLEPNLALLQESSALVVGLGNVGGPAALELARAGFGRIVLIDSGNVEPANLSRGIFNSADLGLPKAIAAANALSEATPGLACHAIVGDARVDIPDAVFRSCDAVLIATDSWSSRMHVNRWANAVVGNVKIVISGGMRGLSWDIVSSVPGSSTGCAQCPHAAEIVNADESGGCGVMGPVAAPRFDPSASFVGALVAANMVLEACVAVGGNGPLFAGRMLTFDRERVCPMSRQFWLASIELISSPSCQPLKTGVGMPAGTRTFGVSGSFSPFR